MKPSHPLYEAILADYTKILGPRMAADCMEDIFDAFELPNGWIVPHFKMNIQKYLLFGYSCIGFGDNYDSATAKCEEARKNPQPFIDENMEHAEANFYNKAGNPNLNVAILRSTGKAIADRVCCIACVQRTGCTTYVLNQEDRQKNYEMGIRQLQNFRKRLGTYLKRYGLSKLEIRTYCMDD